ncbi:hypothetical protein K490DRAFT_30930 [Saccharata proteae CBS 121410]|uniref:Sequence orphan n=1 Tax=Saccharata proteae CBS 121410 TaxID=1314787 RepID=A0A9P4I3X2_9PEZI|nr:hypothetical protein K490DRAFT_30930 [Saccharata proteae CBS 121410]
MSAQPAASSPSLRSSALRVERPSWNAPNLALRFGADCTAAASAGVLVAPVITMIDKAIIENTSGRSSLLSSLRLSFVTLLTRPHRFLFSKPFALIFTLYTGTYLTANTLDTTLSAARGQPASTTSAGLPKFAATSTANLALCLYKDSKFTKMFGAATGAPRAVGIATYGLFAARDSLTIFASFNVPPLLTPYISSYLESTSSALGTAMKKHVDAASVAQFTAPAAVQILSTPLHLLGLDLYNRPGASVGWPSRIRKIGREWGMSCVARICRIVPAFGVGGVVNMKVRRNLMTNLE